MTRTADDACRAHERSRRRHLARWRLRLRQLRRHHRPGGTRRPVAVLGILSSAALTTRRSLLLTTWDKNDNSPDQVATLVIGGGVPTGSSRRSPAPTHCNLLRTIKTAWGLARLTANDSAATRMSDFFPAG